jgi:hypothetical protein
MHFYVPGATGSTGGLGLEKLYTIRGYLFTQKGIYRHQKSGKQKQQIELMKFAKQQ